MSSTFLTNPAPTISVLLPVYNAERYIRAAVESVLTQTFHNFELVVIDDGSTDRSVSILREFETKDSRVRILSRENRGLVITLNELVGLSRGRYLARMDGDDICRPQRFERQLAYLEAHPTCVAVGSRSLMIDSSGMPIMETVNELTHDEIDAAHLSGTGESRMCHPSVMMRREAIMQVGQYHEEYQAAEDLDLFLRLAEIGKLANLPDVLLDYRQHLQSFTRTGGDRWRIYGRTAVRAASVRRRMTALREMSESSSEPETIGGVHRVWAWWALSAGNLSTARKHAILAFAKEPFNMENFRVLACAIRGY